LEVRNKTEGKGKGQPAQGAEKKIEAAAELELQEIGQLQCQG
jgi:hypothetical protein